MNRKEKVILFYLPAFICLGLAAVLLARWGFIQYAEGKADQFIKEATENSKALTREERIAALTLHVHKKFSEAPHDTSSLLYRMRPFVTNSRLPEFLRLPQGAIEMLHVQGWCDNAARMLMFVLEQEGLSSEQLNLVGPEGAHAALVVHAEKDIFMDPFYGVIAQDKGALISPQEAKNLVNSGVSPKNIFTTIADSSDTAFYNDFSQVVMSLQGAPLQILADIPRHEDEPIKIGKIDGNSEDVKADAARYGLTPYWHYMGHVYDRSWQRVLQAHDPVKIDIILTKMPREGVITSNIPPHEISGNKLTWKLDAGENLVFDDSKATISWLSMNSFIPIDQIIITAKE